MERLRRLVFAAAIVVSPAIAAAQDDTAGWLAMVTTPYGSLVPGVTPAMLGTSDEAAVFGGDLEFRYGRLNDGATVLNSFGVGTRVGNLGLVGVWQKCDGCGSRSLAGADYDFIVARTNRLAQREAVSFVAAIRPGVGVGLVSGEGDLAVALATTVDVPLSLSIPLGRSTQLIPHAEPGLGHGVVMQGGRRDARVHGTVALGATMMFLRAGIGLNVGWRQILLDRAAATWGAGLTMRRGGY